MPIRPNDYLPLTGDVDYEVVTGHIGTYDGAWDGYGNGNGDGYGYGNGTVGTGGAKRRAA